MSIWRALGSGLVGACVLNVLHETVRQFVPEAPRVDVLGKRAVAASLRAVGKEVPPDDELYALALTGDVLSNSLYYSLVGAGDGDGAVLRGALLGFGAGVGAVLLPGPLGLGDGPSARTPATQMMTIAWYTIGGLAAGATFRALAEATGSEYNRVFR